MSKELGHILRTLRDRCKLTQQQVAEKLYIDRATYTYWEIGKTEPSIKSLGDLAKLFKVSPEVFFTGVCDRAPKTNFDRIKAMSVKEMANFLMVWAVDCMTEELLPKCNECKANVIYAEPLKRSVNNAE